MFARSLLNCLNFVLELVPILQNVDIPCNKKINLLAVLISLIA